MCSAHSYLKVINLKASVMQIQLEKRPLNNLANLLHRPVESTAKSSP